MKAVTYALGELKDLQAQSANQLSVLAEGTAARFQEVVQSQLRSSAETKSTFEETQAMLTTVASIQAQAAQENRQRMAEVAEAQQQAFMLSHMIQKQLAKTMAEASLAIKKSYPARTSAMP